MANDDRRRFTGEGFSGDPLSEGELKQHRERAHHYDRNFLSVDQFLEKTGLKWMSQMGKAMPAFLKAAGVITAIGGAFIMAQNLGWL